MRLIFARHLSARRSLKFKLSSINARRATARASRFPLRPSSERLERVRCVRYAHRRYTSSTGDRYSDLEADQLEGRTRGANADLWCRSATNRECSLRARIVGIIRARARTPKICVGRGRRSRRFSRRCKRAVADLTLITSAKLSR